MDEMIDRRLRIKVSEDSNDGVFGTHQESRSAVTEPIRRGPLSFRSHYKNIGVNVGIGELTLENAREASLRPTLSERYKRFRREPTH